MSTPLDKARENTVKVLAKKFIDDNPQVKAIEKQKEIFNENSRNKVVVGNAPTLPVTNSTGVEVPTNLDNINDVPTIAPRTYGDYNGNALPIIGDALHSVGGGVANLVTTAGTGYELIGKALTGQEITGNELDENLGSVHNTLGLDTTFYSDMYSTGYKEYLAKQAAIGNSGNSQFTNYKDQLKLYRDNLGYTGLDATKTALQSGIEMLIGTKALQGVRGLTTGARVFGSSAIPEVGHYIDQEVREGNKVDGNTVTNALGSAAVVGGTELIGGKLFGHGNLENLTDALMQGTRVRGSAVKNMGTEMALEGVIQEPIQNAVGTALHNYENNRDLSEGQGQGLAQSQVLGAASSGIMSAPANIGVAVKNGTEAGKALAGKASSVIRQKAGEVSTEGAGNVENLASGKYDPVRAISDNISILNSDSITMDDVVTANNNVVQIRANALAHIHDLQEKIENAESEEEANKYINELSDFNTNYWKPLETQNKLAKQAFKNIAGKLEEESAAPTQTTDEFVQTAADNFVNLLQAPAGTYVDPQVAAQTEDAKQRAAAPIPNSSQGIGVNLPSNNANGNPNFKVEKTVTNRDGKSVNLSTIRTSKGQTVQVATEYAPQFQGFINDLEALGYSIDSLGGFSDRKSANGNSTSKHSYGYSIDINPAKNPNRSTKTDLPVNEVRELVKKWGLGWGLDWKNVQDPMHFSVAPNENGRRLSQEELNRNYGQSGIPAVSGVKSLVAITVAKESAGGDYNIANYDNGGIAKGVRVTEFTLERLMSNADGLNAVGKYQVITPTLRSAVKELGLDPKLKFTPEVQEQIGQWLYFKKNPTLASYIKGGNVSVEDALDDLSSEWQAIGNRNGLISIGKTKGRKAHVQPAEVIPSLQAARQAYAQAKAQGMSDSQAEIYAINNGTTLSSGTGSNTQSSNTDYKREIDEQNRRISDLEDQLSKATDNNNQEQIDSLTAQIDELKQQMAAQQEQAQAQEQANTEQVDSTSPEAQPETVQAKKELPPEVVEQQEVVAQEAIQRARANNLTAQHVDTLEQSGAITQTQAQELRVMLDNQRILTAANTANDVNNEVINGRKRDRSIDSMVGLNNYADILDTAIDTGDTKTLGKFMGYLERFAANRANKSAAINEALLQNPSNDNPIYVVPDKAGNWRVESGLVKGNQELFKAGAFQVWQNNNTNNAVAEESKLTNALLNNYQQIIALRQQNGLLSDFTQQAAQPTHNTQVRPSKFANDPLLVGAQGTEVTPEAIELTDYEQGKVKEYQATYDKQLSDWSLDDFSNVGITISDAQDSTESREVNENDLTIVKDAITQGLKEGKSSLDIINSVQATLDEQGKTIKLGQLSNLETYIKYQQSLSKGSTPSSTTLDESKAGNKNKDGKLHQPKKGSRVRIDGTNVVYQNQADSVNYKPETNNEILVGREYEFSTKANVKSGKPSLKPTANSGLAIFTKDGKLATGESAKGKFFDLSRINEPGALGNPFTSLASAQTITDENGKQVPNSWYVKNRQAEIIAYINLLKHFATSTKDDRMAFLEVLPQLTGKLLVTDFYHQEEALFIDYLVKGLDNVTRTSRKNDSRQDRIAANEAAREWVERITYEFITDDKGNRKIEFSQDNTTPLEELVANRKSGQKPKKPTIDETSDESTEVQETEEVEEIVDETDETEEITDTDEGTSESTEVFDLGEDDTAEIENALEDAPEIMLSRAEKAAQANQQEDESLEDALERTNTELNLDKPQVIHKILDKLMLANALAGFGNQDEETNDYFKEMILALTNYLDDPKVVINDKAVVPTFNGETNTVEVKLSENLLRDIASALIKQSTLDIADEVNNYSIKDYRELAEDAKYQPGILTKDEIAYAKHIANINNKLQTVKEKIAASLETRSVDEGTARLLSIMVNGQLGSVLSIGLTNGKVREFLSSVTYKPNKKATRTSLFKYLLNAFQEFIGVKPKYENVLETLLSIQGDIAEVKLLKSDFNSTEDAKLSAFNITEEELAIEMNKPLDKRNRLLSSFTQNGKTTLSSVKDVANKLLQDPSKGVHFILGEPMTPEQRNQLDDFQEFKNSFVRYLKSSFAVQNKASDMKAYLYDSNGELDDNLVTALALSAYSWFIANGNKELNTFDDVKKLLAMDKDSDAILPARIYRDYKYMGNLSMFVASDLGKTAVAALGIDETADAKRFSKAELEMSLGNWVLSALQNTGMVTLIPMDREQHIKNMVAVGGKVPENVANSNASELLFVTLKPGEEYSRHARIQEIIDSNKGTRGFLSNLFKTDIGLRSPKYKKPTKVKSKIKKSKSIVSNLQATFINKMQSESIEIDVTTLDAVNTLLANNGSWFRQLIGAEVTQSELNKMHVNDRDSAEASAEGLKRELEIGLGFIAGLKRTGNSIQKFWDTIYVARNSRMHFNSNEFNMQSSIIQRMLGSYSNFKTTLSMEGVTLDNLGEKALDKDGKPTKLGLFLSALAMNLEGTDSFIKENTDVDLQAYTKDKVPSNIFMPAFAEWIAQDTTQRAVKAMQNVLNNKVSASDLDAIKSFVDEGSMGMQSFRALVELTNMMSAIENGTELTTSIGLGSDGINNGIALGGIYNGVANTRTMLQTGFIPKDSEFKNYLETRLDRSIGDYYEAYAEVLSETMDNLLNDAVFFTKLQDKDIGEEAVNAIQEIQPAFNVVKFPKPARKLAKAIIIPFGYSAGIARLVQVAQETFIGDIQKQLTDLANEPNATKQTQLENNLRTLLADETFELPSNPKDLLEFWFTPKQVSKLASTYEVIVGEAIDKSLNTFAGDFKAARERNIEMHEHTYQMYERVYGIIVNKALRELANQLEKTPEEIAKRGFTNKEWNALVQPELDRVMPSLYTAFSTTGNDIEIDDTIDPVNDALSGINVFKQGRKLVANKVKSFTRLATGDNKLQAIQNTLPSMEEILEKIGVFGNSAQIQGTDARISAAASAMLGLVGIVNLNIHDQNDGGLDNYVQMVLTQNKATFDVLATNHLQLNSLETFVTMLDEYMNTLSELGLNADEIVGELSTILRKHVGEESAYSLPSEYLEALFSQVRSTELSKLRILQNLSAVQQYAGETGEYVVTDKDVKLAKDQEAVINERMTKLESSLTKYVALEETITETVAPKEDTVSDITSVSDITLHSGGAFGADTLWDVIGRTFGITKANHYRAEDNRKLSAQLRKAKVTATVLSKEEIDFARGEVNKLLKTDFKDNIIGNLQARNYYQVANSDGVYAIAPMHENKRGVSGGTSTAVKLGIKMGKPVYVWDTNTRQWYKHNGKTFEAVDTPKLSKNPATVGTRDIELYDVRDKTTGKYVPNPKYLGDDVATAAAEAIKSVYEKTVSAIKPSQQDEQEITDEGNNSDSEVNGTIKSKDIIIKGIKPIKNNDGTESIYVFEFNPYLENADFSEQIKLNGNKILLSNLGDRELLFANRILYKDYTNSDNAFEKRDLMGDGVSSNVGNTSFDVVFTRPESTIRDSNLTVIPVVNIQDFTKDQVEYFVQDVANSFILKAKDVADLAYVDSSSSVLKQDNAAFIAYDKNTDSYGIFKLVPIEGKRINNETRLHKLDSSTGKFVPTKKVVTQYKINHAFFRNGKEDPLLVALKGNPENYSKDDLSRLENYIKKINVLDESKLDQPKYRVPNVITESHITNDIGKLYIGFFDFTAQDNNMNLGIGNGLDSLLDALNSKLIKAKRASLDGKTVVLPKEGISSEFWDRLTNIENALSNEKISLLKKAYKEKFLEEFNYDIDTGNINQETSQQSNSSSEINEKNTEVGNEKIHNDNVEKLSPILNAPIHISVAKDYLLNLVSHIDNENITLGMLETYIKLLSNAAIDTYIYIAEDESKFDNEKIKLQVTGENSGAASVDSRGNVVYLNLRVMKEIGYDLKEVLFHELNHQVTFLAVTRLISKGNRNEREQAIYDDLVNIGTTLRNFVDVNQDLLTKHELARFNYMFMRPEEFITVPVTERSIQDLLAQIPVNYKGRVHPLFNQMLMDTGFKPQATNMLEAMTMISYELMNMNNINYKNHVIKTVVKNDNNPTKGNTDELLIANRDDIPRIQREATGTGEGSEPTESSDDSADTGSQDTDTTSQTIGTDATTQAAPLGKITNPHSWIADLISKVVKGNEYNPGQVELMDYIFRRIKESGLTIDMTIVDEDTMRSLANGQRELGLYVSGKIYLLDSHVNSGNDFAVAATVLHELLHQLTDDGMRSTDPAVVRAREELERMHKHLEGKIAPTGNAHLDAVIDIVFFTEPDVSELITYGITDPTFTQWMTRNLADFNKDKSGLSNPINELKRFLKVVSVYFKWNKHNDVLTPKPIKSLLKKDEESFEHFVRVVDSLATAISKSSANGAKTITPRANTIAAAQLSNNGSSTAHDEHLNKVNDVIQVFKDSLPEREVAVTASSKNKTNDSLMNLLGLTDKESYTYESVKAVIETFLKTQGNNKTVRELLAIYKELQSGQITKENFVSNWGTATAQERNYAKSVYAQLFGANKSNQKQDHLVKFISLALTSEKFRKAISIKRKRIKTANSNGIFGTLMELFERIVNVFTNMISNLSGKNVSEQVDTLFTKLAGIDARSRSNKLSGFELIWNAKEVVSDVSNKFTRSALNKAISSLPKDPSTFLGKIGTVVNKGVNEDLSKVVTQYLEMYSTYIQKTAVGRGKARYGEIRNLLSDFGNNTQIKKVHDRLVMATQAIGRERQKIKDNTREGLLTKFSNNGANLTKEMREALTSMVLRTDLGSLLDYTNMHTVMSYFNEATRNKTIAALENKIMGRPHGSHMIMQAKDLAKYMITDGGSDTLVKSAQGIAINQGTVYESDFKNMEESLYEDINTLTSLYALKFANDRHGYVFNSLIADEKEGIKALLTLHSDIVKISKKDFNNNPYNYIKGYLPEITNPNRSLTWILEDQLEEYLAQGWERINDDLLPRDASDRSDNRILMFHKHIDYQDRVSGDLDLKDTHSKGYAVYTAADDYLDIMRVAKDKLARQQDREANQDPIAYNPFDNRSSFIPNFGADGAIINYHYEMEGFLRDQYLERNNDALELISVLNAKVQIKPKLEESQRNVARALYADYQRNYALNPLAFVTMTPDSVDPKVVEDYALMPHVFREEAIKLFGKDMPIVVRASVYNTVFGFKTYSIGKMFDKAVNERNALEKILVRVFSSIPVYDANKKYKVSLANAKGKSIAVMLEDIIKALTGFSKDVIVNRGYKVVLGNMIANILLLGIHGVNPITIAKDFTFAWQEGKRYNQAESEKIKLETRLQIETNPSEKAKIKQAIVEKTAYMNRSKIKQYMEIGLMSTIVEDVSTLSDDLGYKTKYEEFVAPVTNHVPKAVKDTFSFLIMSPGTTMHNFISDANQFTDFAAKYTLAKHLQSKGTSFDEAIAVAQENFLNFDIPQGQGMDYMNKIGLFMFTKFFIRFQRVLTKLMLEKPAQLVAHQMMLDGLFDMPSIMQPYLLYNIGNPFDLGAVGMIGAADDMMLPSLFI